MSNNPSSPNQNDIRSLLEELGAVKEILRELSRQLLRMERRVRVAIPATAGASPNRMKRPHLNEQTARQILEKLKERVSKGEQVEAQLREYSVKPDLQTFAKLLGMTNTKLPPKDELVRRISTRLRQAVSVTSRIHEDPLERQKE